MVDGAVVTHVRVGSLASRGAGSFESPRETDRLASMLKDLYVLPSDHGGDVGVAAHLVAFGQPLVGVGVNIGGV